MNRIYRSIWNEASGTFVAVSENAKCAGKRSAAGAVVGSAGTLRGNTGFALKVMTASLMLAFGANVYANPTGGVVAEARFGGYRAKYGNESWELDALAPDVLTRLIQDIAGEYIDNDRWEAAEQRQVVGRETLGKVSRHWEKVEKFLAKKE